MACVCHFHYFALPTASYGYIWSGVIPSEVWKLSNFTSNSLLYMGTHLHRCKHRCMTYGWLFGTCIHPSVCLCIHVSVSMSIHPSICPWDIWGLINVLARQPGVCLHIYLFIHPVAGWKLTINYRAYHMICCWPQHLFYLIKVCYHKPGVKKVLHYILLFYNDFIMVL